MALSLFILGACKRDKKQTPLTFNQITKQTITDNEQYLTFAGAAYNDIYFNAAQDRKYKVGSILLFNGVAPAPDNICYAVMEILSVDAVSGLKFKLRVFKPDGADLVATKEVTLPIGDQTFGIWTGNVGDADAASKTFDIIADFTIRPNKVQDFANFYVYKY